VRREGRTEGRLIDDPRRCDFKPARDLPHCAEGKDEADCFTAPQLAALDHIYGDVMSQGKRIFPGGRWVRRWRGERAEWLDGAGDRRAESARGVDVLWREFLRFLAPA